jgi:hypothetical protein
MYKIIYTTCLVLGALCAQATGGEYKAELEKIQQANSEQATASMQITYQHENGETGEKKSSRGAYHKKGAQYYLETGNQLSICSKQYLVIKSDADKLIIVRDQQSSMVAAGPIPVKKLMQYAKSIKAIESGLKAGQKGLHISVSDNTYEAVDLVYDANYTLARVTLYQRSTEGEKGNKTHVIYSDIGTTVSSKQFDTSSIVQEKNGVLLPGAKYASYRIVDQRRGGQ